MKKISKIFKDLSIKLILEFIKWIIMLVSGFILSYLTPELISAFYKPLGQYKFWFFLLLCLLTILLTLHYIIKFNRQIPKFQELDLTFKYLNSQVIHKFISKNEIIHSKRATIKALKNGINSFNSSFFWSGNKYEVKSKIKEHQLFLLPKKGAFQPYEIKFDRDLKKGEEITFETEFKLFDNGVALPYFGSSIQYLTDLLVLKIEFSGDMNIKEIRKELYYSKEGHYPIDREIGKIDNQGRFEWKIRNPKLLHYYRICWIIEN